VTRCFAIALSLALTAFPVVAAGQSQIPRSVDAQVRPAESPETFRWRVFSATVGQLAGLTAGAIVTHNMKYDGRFPTMLVSSFSGSFLGAAVPRLESRCGLTRRLGWSFAGATVAAVPGLFLRTVEKDEHVAGLISFIILVPIGAAGGVERACARRS
jgi:hypothetical protein